MGLSKYLKDSNDKNIMENNNISNNMIIPQFEGKYQIRINDDKSPPRESKGFGKANTMKDNPNTSTFMINKVRGINYNHNVGLLTGKINGITCVDLDFYDGDKPFDKENNDFIKTFGMPSNDNKYIFDTFTDITPKGGFHLVFEYDEDIRQTQTKDIHNVDIRNDGGYMVQYGSIVKGKSYNIVNDTSIKKMPNELKEWLINNLYSKNQQQLIKEKRGLKPTINKDNNNPYKYNITDEQVRDILDNIDDKYFNTLTDNAFLKYSTFMKVLNKKDIWNEYNKKRCIGDYDKWIDKNNQIWNAISIYKFEVPKMRKVKNKDEYVEVKDKEGKVVLVSIDIVEYFINISKTNYIIDYFKYKPLEQEDLKSDNIVNNQYITNVLELKENIDYLIKSDVGTGKSTLIQKYIDLDKDKFISIVSRVSLGREHYNNLFNGDYWDNLDFYKTMNIYNYKFDNDSEYYDNSLIIQIDSLKKIFKDDNDKSCHMNLKDYIVILDEFNSIIDHLINSPHIVYGDAINTLHYFIRIIKECKQVICLDADISQICFKVLNFCNRRFKYIVNEHKHFENVNAYEMYNIDDMVNDIYKQDKFLVCCDSERGCINILLDVYAKYGYDMEEIRKEYEDDNTISNRIPFLEKIKKIVADEHYIKIITDQTTNKEEKFDLNEHNRIIMSPKIIYGLDCNKIKRNVYCYYKEHTIMPYGMIQQLARNRQIETLYYLFNKKTFTETEYNNYNDCREDILNIEKDVINNIIGIENLHGIAQDKRTSLLYIELKTYFKYRDDCFKSNKFLHFTMLLEQRGFILNYNHRKNKKRIFKENELTDNEIAERFIGDLFDINSDRIYDLNQILQLDDETIIKNKRLATDKTYLVNHFNIIKYYITYQCLIKRVGYEDNFINDIKQQTKKHKVDLASSKEFKFHFLNMILKETGYNDNGYITLTKDITDDRIETFYKKNLKYVYRHRGKDEFDFKNKTKLITLICSLYKNLFGNEIIEKKQIRIDDKRVKKSIFNNEYLQVHFNIFELGRGREWQYDNNNNIPIDF